MRASALVGRDPRLLSLLRLFEQCAHFGLSRLLLPLILRLLVEGVSLRSVTRIADCSINTATKLLVDAGKACAAYHDDHVRDLRLTRRIQVDEIWAFIYAKEKNVRYAKKAPPGAGDAWTWTALDADNKLMVSWLTGPRDQGSAYELMMDLSERVKNRIQLTSDGLASYLPAVEDVFGADVDFAQMVKLFGKAKDTDENTTAARYSPPTCTGVRVTRVTGQPNPAHINTAYVERSNLTIRMGVRRFTRLTNAFSKKLENHAHHVALMLTYYNFCRIHKTLRMTPAMGAGLTGELRDVDWIAGLVEARDPAPGPRGPYKPRTRRRRDARTP